MARAVFSISVLAMAASVLWSGAAWADSIDGNWCAPDGRRISISGITIVTPGGIRMTGDYTRHSFSYVAPAGESDAGAAIHLRLIDEDTVRAVSSDFSTPGAVLHRCKLETS
jgi:hypothetical protein